MERVWVALWVLLAVVIQTSFLWSLLGFPGAPDLIFLLVVFLAMQRESTLGVWSGFWAGLLQDIAGGGPLGLNALVLLIVAYLAGLLRTKLFKENLPAQILIVVVLTFCQQFFMFYWSNTILGTSFTLGRSLGRAAVMCLFHAALAPLLFRLLARWIPGEDVYDNLIACARAGTDNATCFGISSSSARKKSSRNASSSSASCSSRPSCSSARAWPSFSSARASGSGSCRRATGSGWCRSRPSETPR